MTSEFLTYDTVMEKNSGSSVFEINIMLEEITEQSFFFIVGMSMFTYVWNRTIDLTEVIDRKHLSYIFFFIRLL